MLGHSATWYGTYGKCVCGVKFTEIKDMPPHVNLPMVKTWLKKAVYTESLVLVEKNGVRCVEYTK